MVRACSCGSVRSSQMACPERTRSVMLGTLGTGWSKPHPTGWGPRSATLDAQRGKGLLDGTVSENPLGCITLKKILAESKNEGRLRSSRELQAFGAEGDSGPGRGHEQTERKRTMHKAKGIGRFCIGVMVFSVLLSGFWGCNTVKGMGKDIRSLGSAIERSAGGGK